MGCGLPGSHRPFSCSELETKWYSRQKSWGPEERESYLGHRCSVFSADAGMGPGKAQTCRPVTQTPRAVLGARCEPMPKQRQPAASSGGSPQSRFRARGRGRRGGQEGQEGQGGACPDFLAGAVGPSGGCSVNSTAWGSLSPAWPCLAG